MSTRYDNNVLIRITDHFGFGAAGAGAAEVSTAGRIISAANLAAVNAVITAPQGSIALLNDGNLAQNTDGATAWVSRSNQTGLSTIIADPGDTKAIPVVNTGTCALTSAGAETRTLAIPTAIGQTVVLTMDTDAGDIVVTVASAFNVAGNTKLTFADVGDTAWLQAVTRAGVRTWSIQGNDGVALS